MTQYVYGLTDERGIVRYIGRSTNPNGRLKDHWKNRNGPPHLRDKPISQWLRSLSRKPDMIILDIASRGENANRLETFHIKAHKLAGFPLLNVVGMI